MADLKVEEVESNETGWVYDVLVREGGTESRHRVTLSKNDYESLTAGETDPEKLVESSFEFLLEREPKESILSKFEVSVISNYFPEFENQIKDYF